MMTSIQATKRKPPLYLNLSDFKLLVSSLGAMEENDMALTKEEIELKLKIQTIISYIERARLRSRGDSHESMPRSLPHGARK